jgi:prepilin-type N-terminal cleavage/methylation domain-containing protein
MKSTVRKSRRGFSLVELLAVVLILAVLAGVAVPVYLNQRKKSADRACQSNITAIAKAESMYLLSNSAYTASMPALVGGSGGGLADTPKCPLNGLGYTLTLTAGVLTIACDDAANHTTAALHTRDLATPASTTGL